MAVFTEVIDLKDNVSPAAEKAAKEMKILDSAIVSVENALVKAGATGNVKSFQSLTKQLESLKAAQSVIPKGLLEEAAAHDAAGKAASGASNALKDMEGAESGAASGSAGLQAELAEMTGGLSLVVEAAGAVAAGFAVLTIAGAKMAISASEAKGKMISLFDALGEGKIKGEEVDDMLDDMRSKLGVTKDSLVPLAKGFLAMGINGKEALESLTTTAASANAIVDGGAEAFTKMYQQIDAATNSGHKLVIPFKKLQSQLVAAGTNVDDVAKKMGISTKALSDGMEKGTLDTKKFGNALQDAINEKGAGPLANLANSSANLGALLKEYIGDMFEDLGKDIQPFMAAVKDLFGIFDSKAKPSGQALKSGIQAFFKEVFALATKVVPMVKHFLLDVIIFGLKAYIAIKPIIQWFKDLASNASVMSKVQAIFDGLKAAGIALAVVIGVIVVVFATVVAASIAISVAFWALLGTLMEFTQNASAALVGWAVDAVTAAENFIDGLIKGITGGAGKVVDAVKNVASGAKDAFKNALGISSPSKVMMEMGNFVGQGAAQGIEGSASDVSQASASLAGAASSGFASGGGVSGGGSSSGSAAITVQATINFNGSVQGAQELTEQAVSLIFERVALEQGL